ncbi:hypothetical protein CSKR_111103 [Clonorchis sinensis]|uniref:Uncharacterized protein n=1 Tax=Clonorchis sinensis TaxID=79923 RepID=A0A3R7JU92_CLOSI|nr:hypothetical protein CSKR_111103 [Clonorchis sinensis]
MTPIYQYNLTTNGTFKCMHHLPDSMLADPEYTSLRNLAVPQPSCARRLKGLECEFTDRKVRGSNSSSASRLPLTRLGQPGSVPALLLPSGGMAAKYRKGGTAE